MEILIILKRNKSKCKVKVKNKHSISQIIQEKSKPRIATIFPSMKCQERTKTEWSITINTAKLITTTNPIKYMASCNLRILLSRTSIV